MTGSEHYVIVDGTCWPTLLGDVEWRARYAPASINSQRMLIASTLGAYSYLTNPALTQKDAIAALKRARRAEAAARIGGSKIEQDRAATSAVEPRDDEGRPK